MDIAFGEEQIFRLLPMISMEGARERAWDKKTNVFGSGLSGLLSRPKAEEVRISYSECRYEPFWHITALVRYEYERKRNYVVPVLSPEVKNVTILGKDYPVSIEPCQFTIDGIEHCIEEASTDVVFDAVRGRPQDWKGYLRYDKEKVADLSKMVPEGNIVVQPEMRASAAVRQVLASTLRPIQADTIHKESVDVKVVDLYFRPVYAFEYKWETKGKTAVAEFDGLTGEMTTGGVTIRQQVEKVITREVLFDIGAISASSLVPGGGIAVRLVKAMVDSREQDTLTNKGSSGKSF